MIDFDIYNNDPITWPIIFVHRYVGGPCMPVWELASQPLCARNWDVASDTIRQELNQTAPRSTRRPPYSLCDNLFGRENTKELLLVQMGPNVVAVTQDHDWKMTDRIRYCELWKLPAHLQTLPFSNTKGKYKNTWAQHTSRMTEPILIPNLLSPIRRLPALW